MPAGNMKFTNKLGASKMGDGKMGGSMGGKMGSYKPAGKSGEVYNSHVKPAETATQAGKDSSKKGGY